MTWPAVLTVFFQRRAFANVSGPVQLGTADKSPRGAVPAFITYPDGAFRQSQSTCHCYPFDLQSSDVQYPRFARLRESKEVAPRRNGCRRQAPPGSEAVGFCAV